MKSEVYESVWDAIEERSTSPIPLRRRIEGWKVTQAEAAKRLQIAGMNLRLAPDLHYAPRSCARARALRMAASSHRATIFSRRSTSSLP